MAAYNFQRRFKGKIRTGAKRCTIRARRKNGYVPAVGERIDLYVGMRTKQCERVRRGVPVRAVRPIIINTCRLSTGEIDIDGVILDGRVLPSIDIYRLARNDGFTGVVDFAAFFYEKHGESANLYLIEW